MNYLLQATQPTGGFATWGVSEWVIFFGGVGALVASVVGSIKALLVSSRAAATAENNSQRITNTNATMTADRTATQTAITNMALHIDTKNTLPFLLLPLLFLTGCAGGQARSRVLDPAIQNVAPSVVSSAREASTADAEVIASFEQAVAEKRWQDAVVVLPLILEWAEQDIVADVEAGRLGPNAAASPRERNRQLEVAIRKAASK